MVGFRGLMFEELVASSSLESWLLTVCCTLNVASCWFAARAELNLLVTAPTFR